MQDVQERSCGGGRLVTLNLNEHPARGLGTKRLAGDGQQIIQGQQQPFSEFDHDLFLRGCERGLKPLWGVGCVIETVAALPLVHSAFTHAVTQRQCCCSLQAGRHLRSGWPAPLASLERPLVRQAQGVSR